MDGWNLEYDRFLLEPGLFSGVFDVSFREYKSANTLRSSCRSIATQVATLNRYQIHFIFVLDGNPEQVQKLKTYLQAANISHIPPWEKENHAQKCLKLKM